MNGVRLDNVIGERLLDEDPVTDIEIATDHGPVVISVQMISNSAYSDHLRFSFGDIDINTRRELVRLLYTRPDTWDREPYKQDNIIRSFFIVLACIWDSLTSNRKQKKAKSEAVKAQSVADVIKEEEKNMEAQA